MLTMNGTKIPKPWTLHNNDSNLPSAVGYPAVTKVTKADSPLSLADANASSMRPPTPRSISAMEGISTEATFKELLVVVVVVVVVLLLLLAVAVVAA